MSQPFKNILIIGAGGNLGPSIVDALVSKPQFNLSVLARESSKATYPSSIKVHRVADALPEDQIAAAFKGQDVILNLAPSLDVPHQKALIDLAVKAGVKRYLPQEFGGKTTEPKVMEAVPVWAARIAITDYLVSKEKEGLTWTGIVTGAFFDWGLSVGFLGFDVKSQKALIYDDGNATSDFTLLSDIGKATAAVLQQGNAENVNKHVFVNTFHTSQNKILKALEAATGKQWEIEHTTTKQASEEGKAKLAVGDWSGLAGAIVGIHYNGEEWSKHYGVDNQKLLGRGSRSDEELREVVAKYIQGEKV